MSEDTGARAVQEERLRSALHRAAGSIPADVLPPMEETIRQRMTPGGRPAGGRRRIIAPALAAGAIAAVAVAVALLAPVPASHGNPAALAPDSKPKYLVINSYGFKPLAVYDAVSGAKTGQVRIPLLPQNGPLEHTREVFQVAWMASPDDRTFVVGLYRAKPCQSRFYQFTLGPGGKPGPVTPFGPLPAIKGAGIGSMAFSASGRVMAFSTVSGSPACSYKVTSSHLGIVNLATGEIRQWTGVGGSLSLTADGKLLAYNSGNVIKVLTTASPPGPAARYSRTLVRPAQYGPSDWISLAAITPDGRHLYFNVFPETGSGPKPGQIRVAGIGSGRSRIVASETQWNGLMFTNPRVEHVLVYRHNKLTDLDLRTGKTAVVPGPAGKFIGEVFW